MRVGLVADTHGLVRPELAELLAGVDRILHAGDVGKPEVLAALEAVAPVTAVRGNVDRGAWAQPLPEQVRLEIDGVLVLLTHDAGALRVDDVTGVDVVVAGHSHKPVDGEVHGVRLVNPGSMGPRRFSLPICLAVAEFPSLRVTHLVLWAHDSKGPALPEGARHVG